MRNAVKRQVVLVTTIVAALASGASAWAGPADPVNPLTKRFLQGKPLDICDQGSFYVGGVPKNTIYANSALAAGPPADIIIGQMYVQFQIPTKHRQWPLILVHSSGVSGSVWEATPDGRMGWLPYALQNNFSVFAVDHAGRARSGFDRSVYHEARVTNNLSLIPTTPGGSSDTNWTSVSTAITPTGFFGHLIPAGSTILDGTMIRHGDPGDPDPSSPEPGPAHGTYPPAFPIPPVDSSIDANIQARVGAIGPAPNPVNNTYLALNFNKYLISSTEQTLPTANCPTCTPTTLTPSLTWTGRGLAELIERLGGAMVVGWQQGAPATLQMVRILKEHGKLNLLKGVFFPEGATDLARAGLTGADFDHVPFLVVNGDYGGTAPGLSVAAIRASNYAARDAINASPTHAVAPATVIDTDDPSFGGKFKGTTNMHMLGTNNLAFFDVTLNWLDQNVPNPIVATSCPSGKGQGNNGL